MYTCASDAKHRLQPVPGVRKPCIHRLPDGAAAGVGLIRLYRCATCVYIGFARQTQVATCARRTEAAYTSVADGAAAAREQRQGRRGQDAGIVRGIRNTGTGELRTILEACEPRKNRLIAELLVPTARTSPSPHGTAASASAQEPALTDDEVHPGRHRTGVARAEGPPDVAFEVVGPLLDDQVLHLRLDAAGGRAERPDGEAGDPERGPDVVGHRGGGQQQVAVPVRSSEGHRDPGDPGVRLAGVEAQGGQGHRDVGSCAGCAGPPRRGTPDRVHRPTRRPGPPGWRRAAERPRADPRRPSGRGG